MNIASLNRMALAAWLFGIIGSSNVFAGNQNQIPKAPESGTTVSCRSQIEFQGQVTLYSVENNSTSGLPLSVRSVQAFDQITIDDTNALRKYATATAKISIDGKESDNELSETNRQIALRVNDAEFNRPVQYFSTGGMLKQAERDLLLTPADLISVQYVVEHSTFKEGEEWKPEDRAVQAFLSLDNVIENKLKVSVKEITDNVAKLYITGDATGEVDGSQTALRVVAVCLVDLENQFVSAFRGTLNENRSPSQLAPGFVGAIKIDAKSQVKNAKSLTDDVIKKVSTQIANKQNTRMLWNSDSEFELLYDPKWKVILSDTDVVIMRYSERGSLLAQCNVLRLPKRPEGKPLKLKEFRTQLEKTVLGEAEATIKSTQELRTATGMRALQVVVSGVQEEVPIHWIYYHLSNDEGRCAAVVLTIEDELLNSFGNADQKLLESIRFTERKRQAQVTDETAPLPVIKR
ncbi:MAG: hypothetical protein R3C03_05020 [Pirellulaceae bacterium]